MLYKNMNGKLSFFRALLKGDMGLTSQFRARKACGTQEAYLRAGTTGNMADSQIDTNNRFICF